MLDPTPAGNMLVGDPGHGARGSPSPASFQPDVRRVIPPAARGALDPGRLERVRDFIEANLGEDLTIEALANEACLSPFHFARAFKAATGMAPHRYLTSRRLDKARSWIAEGQLSLAEIAFRCGFASQASFTRWFKRLAGATPGEYRASYS